MNMKKRTQPSVYQYFLDSSIKKKPKSSECSTSTEDPAVAASGSSSQPILTQPSESLVTLPPPLDIPEVQSYAENDIAYALGRQLTRVKKYQFLMACWVPPKEYEFPTVFEGHDRNFQFEYLDRYKPWLVYSDKLKGAFCKFCVLFYVESDRIAPNAFVKSAHKSLKHFQKNARTHSENKYHETCMTTGEDFIRVYNGQQESIANQLDKSKKKREKIVEAGVLSIAQTVLFCGRQGVALRGHDDNKVIDPEINYFTTAERFGNFNAALYMRIAAGDIGLITHLQKSSHNAKFCTASSQNEMISIAGTIIQKKIVEQVRRAKFFSILADGTTDISKIDQFSIVLRYYLDGDLKESFVDFQDVSGSTTGEDLADTLLSWCKKLGLDLNNLRGQGYDGAANMTGVFKGVKTRILDVYPKALFTHCGAHVLNLVLGDSCSIPEMKNMFGTVSEIASFFSDSSGRTSTLDSHIPPEEGGRRLPLLCPTRWTSRYVSVDRLWTLLGPVVNALTEIGETGDARATAKASGIKSNIESFPFMVSLNLARHFLNLTSVLSTELQARNLDFVKAMSEVNNLLSLFVGMREKFEDEFREIYKESVETAQSLGIEEMIPRRAGRQTHRSNVRTDVPEDYYRISVGIPFLDHIIGSMRDRFTEPVQKALKIASLLPSSVVDCTETFSDVIDMYKDDLPEQGRLFRTELARWKHYWRNLDTADRPSTLLLALKECDSSYYPCIHTLLSVFVVIPVSVAECERSFSALKRLKTFLRNTMKQERLVGLALLNVHTDITVTPEELSSRFLNADNRRAYC